MYDSMRREYQCPHMANNVARLWKIVVSAPEISSLECNDTVYTYSPQLPIAFCRDEFYETIFEDAKRHPVRTGHERS